MPYFRTELKIVILSEDPYPYTSLENIAYDITYGDCSGEVDVVSSEEIDEETMVQLLIEQGSDPSFLLGEEYKDDENAW